MSTRSNDDQAVTFLTHQAYKEMYGEELNARDVWRKMYMKMIA